MIAEVKHILFNEQSPDLKRALFIYAKVSTSTFTLQRSANTIPAFQHFVSILHLL